MGRRLITHDDWRSILAGNGQRRAGIIRQPKGNAMYTTTTVLNTRANLRKMANVWHCMPDKTRRQRTAELAVTPPVAANARRRRATRNGWPA